MQNRLCKFSAASVSDSVPVASTPDPTANATSTPVVPDSTPSFLVISIASASLPVAQFTSILVPSATIPAGCTPIAENLHCCNWLSEKN